MTLTLARAPQLSPDDPVRAAARTLALTAAPADAQKVLETFSSLDPTHVAQELTVASRVAHMWSPKVAKQYPAKVAQKIRLNATRLGGGSVFTALRAAGYPGF